MADNILKTAVDSTYELIESSFKLVLKSIAKAIYLDFNEHDFKKFYKCTGLKNSEDEYPSLKSYGTKGIYNIYKFNVPTGLHIGDFSSRLDKLAFFMKTNIVNLDFKVSDNFSGIDLYELRFEQIFKELELKNLEGLYPKLISRINGRYQFEIPDGINRNKFLKKLSTIDNDFDIGCIEIIENKN